MKRQPSATVGAGLVRKLVCETDQPFRTTTPGPTGYMASRRQPAAYEDVRGVTDRHCSEAVMGPLVRFVRAPPSKRCRPAPPFCGDSPKVGYATNLMPSVGGAVSFGRLSSRFPGLVISALLLFALLPSAAVAAPPEQPRNYIVTLAITNAEQLAGWFPGLRLAPIS